MKILTIFDKLSKYSELAKELADQNQELIPAESPHKAIEIIKKDLSFDLIMACAKFLQIHNPDILNFLKSDRRYRCIPIIAVCVECDPDSLMSLIRKGVSDVIAYPFKKDVVSAKIERAIKCSRRKIIIIDDEPGIRDILQQTFEFEGYNVIPFSTADEAVQYLKNNDVHAIISDIMLPGTTGVDLLLIVKANYEHIPVILITGHSGKYSPEMVISMGADGYFRKPFHNKELVATLDAVIMRYKGIQKEVTVEGK